MWRDGQFTGTDFYNLAEQLVKSIYTSGRETNWIHVDGESLVISLDQFGVLRSASRVVGGKYVSTPSNSAGRSELIQEFIQRFPHIRNEFSKIQFTTAIQ